MSTIKGLVAAGFCKQWRWSLQGPDWRCKVAAAGLNTPFEATQPPLPNGVARPACVDFWSDPSQHSNGVQAGRAIAALAALVGGYDRPGTLIIPDKRGNKRVPVTPPLYSGRHAQAPELR